MKPQVTAEHVLRFLLLAVFLGAILWYLIFQSRNLIQGPTITLTTETGGVQSERVITLEGVAENIVSLSLNGRQIHTDQKGAFTEALVLENGYTIMTLTAEDRYGRSTSLSRSFVYRSDS